MHHIAYFRVGHDHVVGGQGTLSAYRVAREARLLNAVLRFKLCIL